MSDKIPWYIKNKMSPEEVKKWLIDKKRKIPPKSRFSEYQYRLHRERLHGKRLEGGESPFRCLKCGRHLHVSVISERHRKLLGDLGKMWICCSCAETYFAKDLKKRRKLKA